MIGYYLVDVVGYVCIILFFDMLICVMVIVRYFEDLENLVYYVDMEGLIWEVDVCILDVKWFFVKFVLGWYGKGGYIL